MVGVLAEHGVDATNQGERLLLRRPRCEPAHSRALAFGSAEQEREIAHDTTSSSARRGRNGAGVTLTGLTPWLAGHGQGGRLGHPLYHLGRLAPAPRQEALDRLDSVDNLVLGHAFDAALRLDLHFLWHKQNQKLKENSGLVLHHLLDRLAPTELECPMHLQNGVLVQRLTRGLRGPARVPLMPRREPAGASGRDD